MERRKRVLRLPLTSPRHGETLGVAEALALAESARDPELVHTVHTHRRIAADEQRHADLAWKTLAWLMDGADAATRRFAVRCFENAVTAAGRDPEPRAVARPEHGLLEAREIGALRRQVLREIVAPCAAALLGAPSEVDVEATAAGARATQ